MQKGFGSPANTPEWCHARMNGSSRIHMNESCRAYGWVMSHADDWVVWNPHMNESCRKYVNQSWHTHMNQSWHTMSHASNALQIAVAVCCILLGLLYWIWCRLLQLLCLASYAIRCIQTNSFFCFYCVQSYLVRCIQRFVVFGIVLILLCIIVTHLIHFGSCNFWFDFVLLCRIWFSLVYTIQFVAFNHLKCVAFNLLHAVYTIHFVAFNLL